MTSCDWTVEKLGEAHGWASRKGGSYIDYWMGVTDGHEDKWVYTTRKSQSQAPQIGDTIYGHLEYGKTQAGKDKIKLVKDQEDQPRRLNGQSGLKQSGPADFDPRSLRIERQHSQEMALRTIAIFGPDGTEGTSGPTDQIKEWTDYFMEDLDAYEAARRGVGGGGSPNAAASPRAADDSAEPSLTAAAPSVQEVTEEQAQVVLGGAPGGDGFSDPDDIPFAPLP